MKSPECTRLGGRWKDWVTDLGFKPRTPDLGQCSPLLLHPDPHQCSLQQNLIHVESEGRKGFIPSVESMLTLLREYQPQSGTVMQTRPEKVWLWPRCHVRNRPSGDICEARLYGAMRGKNKEAFLSLGKGVCFILAVPLCRSTVSFPALSSHFLTHMLGLRSTKAFNSS